MKLKQVVVTNKMDMELQKNNFYVEDLFLEENKLNILVLAKSDIEKIEKNISEYRNHKGVVFEKAINAFNSCKMEDFMKAYIMCYCNMYDFLELDYDYIGYKFHGVTCSRSEQMERLEKMLKHFSFHDEYNECGVSFCEVEKMFFKTEYCW